MTDQQGWISLHRKIQQNSLWLSEPFTRSQAWIDLILLANHKDNFFFIRGNKIEVKRGQIARGQDDLASRWKWSKGKVIKFLKLLESEQQIEQQKSRIINKISIVNYNSYQQIEQQTEQQNDYRLNNRSNNRSNTNNNDNNKNNDNNENNIDKFLLPDWIPKDTWFEFMKIRKKLKASDTDYAKKKLINQLERFKNNGYDVQVIIDNSILNGWKGVFEPKEKPKQEKSDDWAKTQLQALREMKV